MSRSAVVWLLGNWISGGTLFVTNQLSLAKFCNVLYSVTMCYKLDKGMSSWGFVTTENINALIYFNVVGR